jgi:hypothetical protein
MDIRDVYVIDAAVVIKMAILPIPSLITLTEISVAIIDSAIVTNLQRPVPGEPHIVIVHKSPVTRCPQISRLGRLDPRARHPVVAIRTISPIARHPDETVARAGRLVINRKLRRGEAHHDLHIGKCGTACERDDRR